MEKSEVKLNYSHSNYLFYIPTAFHNCTLDNFDWRDQSPLLYNGVKSFIEGEIRGLYLHGMYGVGKTHLLVALYRVLLAQEDDVSDIYYINFEELIHEVQSKLDIKEPVTEYLDIFCEVGTLFMDDITATLTVRGKQTNQDEILRKIINKRYENELSTCFTSNLSLSQLIKDELLHPHAVSRIQGMCVSLLVKGKDRRNVRGKHAGRGTGSSL